MQRHAEYASANGCGNASYEQVNRIIFQHARRVVIVSLKFSRLKKSFWKETNRRRNNISSERVVNIQAKRIPSDSTYLIQSVSRIWTHQGVIHNRHFCTQYWYKKIKRHFDENIFFFKILKWHFKIISN